MNSCPQDTSSCHTVTGYLELNNHPMVMTDLHADMMYDLETDRRKKYEEIHHSTLPPYPFFDGCSSFMKWLETYDSYGTACGWNHAQRASALRLFLKGRASEVYELLHLTPTDSYETICYELRTRLSPNPRFLSMKSDLAAAKRGQDEGLFFYFGRLQLIFKEEYPASTVDTIDAVVLSHIFDSLDPLFQHHLVLSGATDLDAIFQAAI